ncbi:MerR family transcriptional regulator [Streptomyces sp. MUM 203J]|uniref:MerR family transcriptional regulator n=1 Tax=Streptomyces sp. MUM 203J TaxID=2791990 RepID=UPI001F0430D8|nr:MerR family transcriptional regulator [Streptomyces sp. MUM 203J]MCH0542183.1 MerR family transcriptional regulator [Streptomyces sp. MUM 203J]
MEADGLWSIGELAARAGTTVKTVRFYSDQGLLPEAARSSGGHRRYGPDALERLRLIRTLRGLELPVPQVGRVLEGAPEEPAVRDVLAARLREVGSRMAALRWQEAALRLLHDCAPGERAERLSLLGGMSAPPDTTVLAAFWRRWLPPRMPSRVVGLVVDHAVPVPPEDPTPDQVLALARLHALVVGGDPGKPGSQPRAHRRDGGLRPGVLYEGLAEAYALASAAVRQGRRPGSGEALDCFVAAYAQAGRGRDTSAFRRALSDQLAGEPRIDAYWHLVAELSPPGTVTPGAAHDWLTRALAVTAGGRSHGTP